MNIIHRSFAWRVIVAGLAAIAPSSSMAENEVGTTGGPQVPAETCIYYEHSNFAGNSRSISVGVDRKYVGDAWNDKISSIACASGCQLTVWEHRDFVGGSRDFAGTGATLYVGDAWNDRISSMMVSCDTDITDGSNCAYGPDTCDQGFVWREASTGDHVCVAPAIRDQARQENALNLSRRAGGGAYGPDTCLSGFVWREAFNGDTVCVPPESREQARRDNARAPSRVACRP